MLLLLFGFIIVIRWLFCVYTPPYVNSNNLNTNTMDQCSNQIHFVLHAKKIQCDHGVATALSVTFHSSGCNHLEMYCRCIHGGAASTTHRIWTHCFNGLLPMFEYDRKNVTMYDLQWSDGLKYLLFCSVFCIILPCVVLFKNYHNQNIQMLKIISIDCTKRHVNHMPCKIANFKLLSVQN